MTMSIIKELFKILEDVYGMNTTIKKILSSYYWWPTMHKDVVELCQNCDICQRLKSIW
jgi:hypothetical protein